MNEEINLNGLPAKFKQEFLQAYKENTISHAYLFVGLDSETLERMALWLSCLFLCENVDEALRPDGDCSNCQRVLKQSHPDVFIVKETEKQSIGIDTVRPLKVELTKSPTEGDRRFFIISDAQKLTASAANALLNLLEDPIAPVLTILTTTNVNQILPTIKSRVQIVNVSDEKVFIDRENSEELREINELTKKLSEQLINHDTLSILTAKQIANITKKKELQVYVLDYLVSIADSNLQNLTNIQENQQILSLLLTISNMLTANVSFLSCLQYLILNIEF